MKCSFVTTGNTVLLYFNGRHVATFAKSDIALAHRVMDLLNAPVDVEPEPEVDYSAEEDPVYHATHVRTSAYVAALDGLAAALLPVQRQALLHGNGTAATHRLLSRMGLVVDGKRTPLGDDVMVRLT